MNTYPRLIARALVVAILLSLLVTPVKAQSSPTTPQLHLPMVSTSGPQTALEQNSPGEQPPIYLPFVNRGDALEPLPLDEPQPYAASTVLVRYQPTVSAAELDMVRTAAHMSVQALTVEPLSPLADDAEKITLVPGVTVEQAVATLTQNPNVLYAEPDYLVSPAVVADDPYYTKGQLWGMYGDAFTPKNAYGSQANEAWAVGDVGSSDVYVGLIDEGVDYEHEDLAANIWVNPYDALDGVDNDGNGYIDDVRGWDFYNENNSIYDPADGDDHGTHVAGTIGAVGGNGVGVAGVNWRVTIIDTKFLGPQGGYISDAVRALDYLTDLKQRHALNIVATNNSWGGGGFSQSLLDAINRSGDAGTLFVVAAGNGGRDSVGDNIDTYPVYPASYQCTKGGTRGWDCVISVTAIASTGTRPSFANYGLKSVDLGAPGATIYSTLPRTSANPRGAYGSYYGTSMATPHVTGAVALCAASRVLMGRQIKEAILASAAPTSYLASRSVTGGRLDIGAMMTRCRPVAPPTPPAAPQSLLATGLSATQIRLTWDDKATNETGYEVERGLASDGPFTRIAVLSAGSTMYTDSGLALSTTYHYRVRAVNAVGNSDYATAQATTPTAIVMTVQSVSIAVLKTSSGFKATATVKIVDAAGAPISAATVTGDFTKNGVRYNTRSSVTDSTGVAKPAASTAITATKGSIIQFCVTNITKTGYAYVPGAAVCAQRTTW